MPRRCTTREDLDDDHATAETGTSELAGIDDVGIGLANFMIAHWFCAHGDPYIRNLGSECPLADVEPSKLRRTPFELPSIMAILADSGSYLDRYVEDIIDAAASRRFLSSCETLPN
jgi:hypothetical protein